MNSTLRSNRKGWINSAACLLLAILLSCSDTAQATELTFLTHSLGEQAYVDDDGQLRGKERGGRRAFYIELVREMMQITGHPKAIAVMPFKRALLLVQSTPGHALFNVNRTDERENTLKWVGPLQSSVSYLYDNINRPTGVKTVEEAKAVESICVMRGNVHHRYLESQGFGNLYLANSYVSCIRMLALGRVSMTPLSNLSLVTSQPTDTEFRDLHNTSVKLMESEGYLAFSKETPDEVVMTWQGALDKLKASGRYDELLEQYQGDD